MDDPKGRPIQIVLSDLGSYGSITVHGKPLSVLKLDIHVAPQGSPLVQLTVLGSDCNIEFDYEGQQINEGDPQ